MADTQRPTKKIAASGASRRRRTRGALKALERYKKPATPLHVEASSPTATLSRSVDIARFKSARIDSDGSKIKNTPASASGPEQ